MQEGEVHEQSDLRAVVLGWDKSLKSSVINTILGETVELDFFVKSKSRRGEVNGRKIILINTPSWWKVFGLQDSPEVVKHELVCSVFLCPPGPHVFLLVIDLSSSFTNENRISIEDHLSLFGERIWTHTILIFTQTTSTEQHIQNPGDDLRLILQKCEGRYHVFDIENNGCGVKELLKKIDGVIAENSNTHFEACQEKLLKIQRKSDENKTKAEARRTVLKNKEKLLRETPSEERVMVLLGWIVSGKSSVGNTMFNAETFKTGKTKTCTNLSGYVNNRKITVMDTPGCWKYFSAEFNPEFVHKAILECIKQSQYSKNPHAMILVIPADTAFKEEQRRVIEEYMAIFSKDVWRHTIVLFTWGDRYPDIPIERHIESEGEALQWLIDKCGNRYHVFDNTNKENRHQVTQLLEKVDEMVEENCLFRLDAHRTSETHLHIDHVLKLLEEEFRSRFTKMKMKTGKTGTESVNAESDDSIDKPPNLSADEKLKDLIKREVRRWEAIKMDELSYISQKAEVSCDDKVLWWRQKCEEYSSGCETSSNRSDLTDDPQNIECISGR